MFYYTTVCQETPNRQCSQQFNNTGIEYPDELHKSLRNFKEALIIIEQEHRIIRIDKILLLERQVQQQGPGDCNNQRHVAHRRLHKRRKCRNTHIPQQRIHLRSFLFARLPKHPHQSQKLESSSKKKQQNSNNTKRMITSFCKICISQYSTLFLHSEQLYTFYLIRYKTNDHRNTYSKRA